MKKIVISLLVLSSLFVSCNKPQSSNLNSSENQSSEESSQVSSNLYENSSDVTSESTSQSSINTEISSESVSQSTSSDISSEISSEISSVNSSENTSENISSSSTISSESSINKTYTITWKNDNGDILEVDNDVIQGSFPSYNSSVPAKTQNGNIIYVFSGWTPSLSEVVCDTVYTATYTEFNNQGLTEGLNPVVSNDGKTIKYGYYPQTNVNNQSLITTLNGLTPLENGWVLYEGNFYTKSKASVYNNETYSFDNGASIVNGNSYWFKCEPIEWDIVSVNNGKYYVVSSLLLDTSKYYDNYLNRIIGGNLVYANNYNESSVRSFLNNEFYNTAFALNNSNIQEVYVDNGTSTSNSTTNPYSTLNTLDKVYLLSYSDYLNINYGFASENGLSSTRTCKTTDYCRASGAWVNTSKNYLNNGTYWTRTATSEYYYCAWNVNSGGYLSEYAVDGTNHCIRPAITIAL